LPCRQLGETASTTNVDDNIMQNMNYPKNDPN
jgi:hypothetical protein